jgi:hypothetical protein
MVYLPMAYLYGKKFIGPITPTILDIRDEIYVMSYDKIDWSAARTACAKVCQIPCCFYFRYLHGYCGARKFDDLPSVMWN